MRIIHDLKHSIALERGEGNDPVWVYRYGGLPKPCFHPVRTPAGNVLTNYEPFDHPWHRGMWFTIKFVGDDNFWEEHEPFGTQKTTIPPMIAIDGQGGISLRSALDWVRPSGATAIKEIRNVAFREREPDGFVFDWDVTLVMQETMKLDRTPFTTWGGYGGLVLRGTRNWKNTRFLTAADPAGADGETRAKMRAETSPWCDLSGELDGGVKSTGGFAIFDHPQNVRHPTPWYGHPPDVNFLNAAFLFNEGLDVKQGQSLRLRYRVLVHDGLWETDRLQSVYAAYCQNPPA